MGSSRIERVLLACGLWSTACFDPAPPQEVEGSTSTSTTSDSTSSSDTSSSSSSSDTSSSSSSSSSSTSAETSTGESLLPDMGGVPSCDPFTADCPDGTKCNPYADDGGARPTGFGCFPLAEDPVAEGGRCKVEGELGSGVDDCEAGTTCADVDPATADGQCRRLCDVGQPCVSPAFCAPTEGDVVSLCFVECDALLQNCAEGHTCVPMLSWIVCALDVSNAAGIEGDACAAFNDCNPGLFCADSDSFGACPDGGAACCEPFCDPSDPMACIAEPDTQCVPAFAGLSDVGSCAVVP